MTVENCSRTLISSVRVYSVLKHTPSKTPLVLSKIGAGDTVAYTCGAHQVADDVHVDVCLPPAFASSLLGVPANPSPTGRLSAVAIWLADGGASLVGSVRLTYQDGRVLQRQLAVAYPCVASPALVLEELSALVPAAQQAAFDNFLAQLGGKKPPAEPSPFVNIKVTNPSAQRVRRLRATNHDHTNQQHTVSNVPHLNNTPVESPTPYGNLPTQQADIQLCFQHPTVPNQTWPTWTGVVSHPVGIAYISFVVNGQPPNVSGVITLAHDVDRDGNLDTADLANHVVWTNTNNTNCAPP